jgi:WD40 repeat protein
VSPGNGGQLVYLADSQGFLSCRDVRAKGKSDGGGGGGEVFSVEAHLKKINTVSVNPAEPHYLATGSLDRTVKIWDTRMLIGGRKAKAAVARELAVLPEPGERSVNGASFSPSGERLLSVSQSNQLRLYANPHKHAAGPDSPVHPTDSIYHDNKTGRWLAVFRAAWDPKQSDAFLIGSMARPRQAEIYTTEDDTLRRLMSLQDPDYLASVQSRNCFHPTLDVVMCANASGRVHVFR